ncbi:MAG: ABC transporter transmembrane domain-containing protein [Bacteroidota bacterium]|nr:ABC transporter transmembrane domain-containing protein [Bacteroidota bacterium]
MAKDRFGNRIVDDNDKVKVDAQRLRQLIKLMNFVKPYRFYFISGLIFLIFSSTTMLAFPYLAGQLIDSATGKSTIYNFDINSIAILLGGILFFQAIFSYLRVYTFSNVSERAISDVRAQLYNQLIRLPITFFDKRRVGELTSRLSADVTQLQDVLSFTLAEFFRQISVLVIGVIILLFSSTKLTLFMLLTFPVIVVGAIIFGRMIRNQSKKSQDELANSNIIVEETLQNIQVVKIFTNEWFESFRYQNALSQVTANSLKTAKNRGLFISFLIFGLFGGIVLVLWYGAGLVSQGQISIGGLTSFIIYTSFIGASVGGLGDMYGQLQKTLGATERIFEILAESPEVDLIKSESNIKVKGYVQFQKVHFSYPTRKDVNVLKGVDFEIFPGETIAIVGQSGAGKSTIAQLLLKFHEVDKGIISIDNLPVSDYSIQDLRHNIGVVPQEILLFGGTIKENIAYGKPDATDNEIYEAASKANAIEFIEKFPDQFQTIVGERGVKLSGGQRQRIAIARAILKNPPILILDEATSSLDASSEKLVQSALDELMKNRTTLVIAHRLSTIRNANKIVVLQDGTIVETGNHMELAQNKDGAYNKLLKLQSGLVEASY